jgi:hypothetical protein
MNYLPAAIAKATVPKLANAQKAFTVPISFVLRIATLGLIAISLPVPESAMGQEIPLDTNTLKVNAKNDEQPAHRLHDAIDRGFKILRKGVENYPEHRSCFSCHHQALPLLAFSMDAVGAVGLESSTLEYRKLARSIHQFTEESFVCKRELIR